MIQLYTYYVHIPTTSDIITFASQRYIQDTSDRNTDCGDIKAELH